MSSRQGFIFHLDRGRNTVLAIFQIFRFPVQRIFVAVMATTLLLAVPGCSSDDEDNYVERPVKRIYDRALNLLNQKNYKEAAKEFEEVERQHPYSSWARRALVMASFAYYQDSEYDKSILAAKRYISLHPGSNDAAYAHYLLATSYYEQITDVGRDQDVTRKALKALKDVVRKFPESDYAKDAQLKIDLTRDHLAGKEMTVGRFYMKKKAYLAAINRFKKVVKDYQTTSHIEEALMRLTEMYLTLGVKSEAQTAAAVLGHNYPGSKWYKDAFAVLKSGGLEPREDTGSWISRAFKNVF